MNPGVTLFALRNIFNATAVLPFRRHSEMFEPEVYIIGGPIFQRALWTFPKPPSAMCSITSRSEYSIHSINSCSVFALDCDSSISLSILESPLVHPIGTTDTVDPALLSSCLKLSSSNKNKYFCSKSAEHYLKSYLVKENFRPP